MKLPEDEEDKVGHFTIGPAPERDWEMVPPDGKWGWWVLIGERHFLVVIFLFILYCGTPRQRAIATVEKIMNPVTPDGMSNTQFWCPRDIFLV